ncbi:UNVERIFIED_CONTAM: hypothetical protein K2H54_033548 [Gekko kuhli]
MEQQVTKVITGRRRIAVIFTEGCLTKFLQSSLAAEQHIFKQPVPHASLMGLNPLATQKRREKERQASGGKYYKDLADGKDSPTAAQEQLLLPDGDKGDSPATSGHSSHKDRHYRSAWVETPSHTGGVSQVFWECTGTP